jgi:diguanylate cyclase (GGDEF)-like protein/PAS domain S-box-containing protein
VQEQRLDGAAVLAALPDPVVVIDPQARILWANRAAEDWSGWRLDAWRGRDASALVHPDDAATALASLASVQDKSLGTTIEIRFAARWGTYRHFEVRGRSELGTPGIEGIVLVLRDVTDRRRWELASGASTALQAVLDHAPAITMILGRDGRLRSASRGLTTLLGHDLETTIGRPLADLVRAEERPAVCEELAAATTARCRSFEATFLPAAVGTPLPLNVTVTNLLDDRAVEGLVVTAVDISPLVDARERLQHLATHDGLTGLPNRALFLDRLERALAQARRWSGTIGVIYCDVDGFKAVNDQHGHACGDAALAEVARRLVGAVRGSDTVARIGGDEFVVIVEEGGFEITPTIVERIEDAVCEPVVLPNGDTATLSISCGAVRADGTDEAGHLLAAADSAMYAVKRAAAPL